MQTMLDYSWLKYIYSILQHAMIDLVKFMAYMWLR